MKLTWLQQEMKLNELKGALTLSYHIQITLSNKKT